MPDTTKKLKPRISIIGTGRLGTALAVALTRKGYAIRSVVARRSRNARKAAHLVNDAQVLAAKEMGSLLPADLFLISTPDDQIASVAAQLSRLHLRSKRKPTALHTSGALSAEVLTPLRERGWSTGSIHPLISVSDKQAGDAPLVGAFWSVEGDKAALRLAKVIVRDLEGKFFSIRSEDKPLYHAAAVMASGNVVALFDVALEMLMQCGLTRKTARSILLPLIFSTIQNLETKDPVRALTGTFSRGDLETVQRHLKALKSSGLADALELYRLLGKRSLRLAQMNRLDPRLVRRIKEMLAH